MLTRFNHVAIVVPDLELAAKKYKEVLNANVSKVFNYSEHGVSVVFVDLGNSKIELMYPFGEKIGFVISFLSNLATEGCINLEEIKNLKVLSSLNLDVTYILRYYLFASQVIKFLKLRLLLIYIQIFFYHQKNKEKLA